MQTPNPSFCVVASTLPVGFIATQVETLRIRRIYVLSKEHERSYQNLQRQHPALQIVRLPSSLLRQSLHFLFLLMRARLTGTSVIFFHECCLPIFDLLIGAIRPRGAYYPQVTMSGFEELDVVQFPRNRMFRLLDLLRVTHRFRFYRSPRVGDNAVEYVLSIRDYPDTIKCADVQYSRQAVSRCYSCNGAKTNRILFITGKSFVADEQQADIFRRLAAVAHAKGYVCHVKDHPNPVYRLDLHIDGAISIDPLQPVELMDKGYHLAVGVSSTALLGFNERAVSLLNMLENMSQQDRLLCIKHLEDAFPGNRINYIRSVDEFGTLL